MAKACHCPTPWTRHIRALNSWHDAPRRPLWSPCHYNQVIALDHCPHDVQDMSRFTHPHADARRGEYGCVAQALHIGKTLLPTYLPRRGS
ncbi:hypothetical protein NMD68_11900 [Edwardsiella tarda]|uniref:hypothetical protein n=1 Tax=Edwardsiella tarda TaxID=636 RepID=UPI00351C00F4